MQRQKSIRDRKPSEDGFMLLLAVFLLALLVLSLSVAIPVIAREIQRDHEVETMHRGLQYRRAIQLYYRKFHNYPPSIDVLVKSNNTRFLRKKYIDPLTGKDDWKTIAMGQNKAPLAMGFFGQPLAGAGAGAMPMGGAGQSGVMGINATTGSTFGGSSNNGGSGTLGSIFGSTNTGGGSTFGSSGSGSTFGTNTNTNSGGGLTGPTDGSGNTNGTGNTASGGTTGSGGATTGTGTSSTLGPASGQAFGGSIIGVSPIGAKQSILLYKKKNHYNEWEFTYSPLSEQKSIMGGSGATGLPGQNGTNGFGGTTGSGFGGSGSGLGGSTSGGFGGSTFGGSGNGPGTNQAPAPQQNQQF